MSVMIAQDEGVLFSVINVYAEQPGEILIELVPFHGIENDVHLATIVTLNSAYPGFVSVTESGSIVFASQSHGDAKKFAKDLLEGIQTSDGARLSSQLDKSEFMSLNEKIDRIFTPLLGRQ